jgi:hypothetical protein
MSADSSLGQVAISERGSMIVPVSLAIFGDLPAELVLADGTKLTRKAELHMTVFNYALGKLLKKAFASQPRLETALNQEAAAFAWKIEPTDTFYHLVNDTPGKPALQTVVCTVDAQVASFYHAARELVGEDAANAPELQVLKDALLTPPPPHVTLYTSDAKGIQGIGLNTVAELEAAIGLAETPAAPPGLRAFRLPSAVIRGS